LTFRGSAWTPGLDCFVQIDADSDQSEVPDVLDYFFSYDIGHAVFCCDKEQFGLKVGKFKVPYNRARRDAARTIRRLALGMHPVFRNF
jgi:hypothetical protein